MAVLAPSLRKQRCQEDGAIASLRCEHAAIWISFATSGQGWHLFLQARARCRCRKASPQSLQRLPQKAPTAMCGHTLSANDLLLAE
jgi:hypothetical protein